ncbi:MAG: histidinol dehydrogenase [Candidatus Micrarchaeia archaeon]
MESVSDYLSARKQGANKAQATALKIVEDVQARGFAAVAEYSQKFDGVEISRGSAAVSGAELARAEESLTVSQREAMLEMKNRISSFARLQKQSLKPVVQTSTGGKTSLIFKPVKRVGIYVPAGRAPLFSSLFMAAIPAIEAGVQELAVCTPPGKDGCADKFVLAAAQMCGIKKVFRIGGAQAIASMAFGLEGILEPVDVICGPGNAYVNAAKMAVAGMGIRIDVPAGPSEVLVIADETADAAFVASDMLAQAEHGEDSAAICICASSEIARQVANQLESQLSALPQSNAAWKSIPKWGRIWIAKDAQEAINAANTVAVEHLELMVMDAGKLLPQIRNAGAIFVRTAEAFCDYGMSGGNHILPTGAAARSWGGVSVQTFGKWVYVDEISEAEQVRLAKKTALLARMEGLEAHARAAEQRSKEKRVEK